MEKESIAKVLYAKISMAYKLGFEPREEDLKRLDQLAQELYGIKLIE